MAGVYQRKEVTPMSHTIIYERLDGSTFVGSVFHPRMEHAGVIDPADGRIKVFKTQFDSTGKPLKRVELQEVNGELQE